MNVAYLVLRRADPPEAFPFDDLGDAERFYERARTQWGDDVVYLCQVLRAADRPADEQPDASARPGAPYVVLRKLETDPPEAFPFDDLGDAERFYDRAGTQWTGVYLCQVLRAAGGPLGDAPPPRARRPSWDEYFLGVARAAARRSTCLRVPDGVGCVLVRDRQVVATGYAGSVRGLAHCVDVGCSLDAAGRCTRTVHAEVNAALQAARGGGGVSGATAYCTMSPCWACFKALANGGVGRVVFVTRYDDVARQEAAAAALGIGWEQVGDVRYAPTAPPVDDVRTDDVQKTRERLLRAAARAVSMGDLVADVMVLLAELRVDESARLERGLLRARRALESVTCLAAEGPEAYLLEGRSLSDLLAAVAREAGAAAREIQQTVERGGS